MNRRTVSVVVSGRVQGVHFRAWTMRMAESLGLDGWVRNRRDGSVEAVLSGDTRAVFTMLERLNHGPPEALVTDVSMRDEPTAPPSGFTLRPTQ